MNGVTDVVISSAARTAVDAYRHPDAVPSGAVQVVGGGNTGFQIAAELAGSHDVHLSIGSRQLPSLS